MKPEDEAELRRLSAQLADVSAGVRNLLARLSTPDLYAGEPDWPNPKSPEVAKFKLTDDQDRAWTKIRAWLPTKKPFFLLKGVAGSGKSYLMQLLAAESLSVPVLMTAPTNKATGVLSEFLKRPCRTIYSQFGLRMQHDEDKMVLADVDDADLPPLPRGTILVVDEAGMVPRDLVRLLKRLAEERAWRFVLVGDPYQLNPVGERTSSVWKLTEDPECRSMMREVKRFDNQILALSIKIREAIRARDFKTSPIVSDYLTEDEGVFVWSHNKAMKFFESQPLGFWKHNKVAGWRNKTVNNYNTRIRKGLGFSAKFEPGEILLLGAPVLENDVVIAHTDDELELGEAIPTTVSIGNHVIECDELVLMDKSYRLTIPRDATAYQGMLAQMAAEARARGKKRGAWSEFWDAKSRFHSVRYGYAMTGHRLQGSTTTGLYADQMDVLANPESLEAFRLLYVMATRPTTKFVAF